MGCTQSCYAGKPEDMVIPPTYLNVNGISTTTSPSRIGMDQSLTITISQPKLKRIENKDHESDTIQSPEIDNGDSTDSSDTEMDVDKADEVPEALVPFDEIPINTVSSRREKRILAQHQHKIQQYALEKQLKAQQWKNELESAKVEGVAQVV